MSGFPRAALVISSSDPNDPTASDIWAEVGRSRMYRLSNASRGRQYELGQSIAGRLDAELLNIDEYLNPANTTSPLLSNAKLMRRVRWMAVYPADGAGNLINSGNIPRADPSFESYTVGQQTPFFLYFGAPPTVTATNPHSGSRASAQTITAGGGLQGSVVQSNFVPGDTYTISVWVRQTAANRIDLAINGHLATPLASTAVSGSYVQLVGVFVPDQSVMQVCVVCQAPASAATLTIDDIQIEQTAPINDNPHFDTGIQHWQGGGGAGTITWSTTQVLPPHQGSMLITPTGGAGTAEADADPVPVTVGQTYSASAWVNCNITRTAFVTVNWFDASNTYVGTATLTDVTIAANTWTQIQMNATVPAGVAKASIVVGMRGSPPASNLMWVDEAILTGPSALTTTGPRIRGLWGGHVSALPVTWDADSNGYTGVAKLSAVGPLATLAQIGVKTDFVQKLASKAPDYWWPLADGSNATTFAEVSGNNGPPLVRMDANGGAPTFSPGTQFAIPGDPGATGVTIAGGDPTTPNGPATVLATGMRGTPLLNVGSATKPFSISVLLYLSHQDIMSFTQVIYPMLICDPQFAGFLALTYTGGATSHFSTQIYPANGSTAPGVSNTDTWGDQKPHMVVLTATIGTSTGYITMFVDGVLVGSSGNQDTSTWVGPFNMGVVQIGGGINPNNAASVSPVPNGIYDHFAIWNRELSAQDVTDLWTAAKGFAGETTGQRLTRLLGQYYVGPTVIDTGRTTLVASGATDGTKLQQIAQRVTDSEAGVFKENRDGALEFDSRDSRFLTTTPQAVFGENVTGGEIPYRDTPVIGYDLTQVTNDATITQTDGTKATAADTASQKSYYQRSTSIQTDTQSGPEAIDYANWLVATRKQPKQRVERITVDPGANPSLWPYILDLEIGQRYTIKRRAKAANSGAGITMSADYFLEWIGHRQVDFEKGTWLVDLILSPAPLQPWILGDSTYGQLGITTVLGF